eukprot:CCRYP_013509-RB/>CCRYP_013509-RB protein AED:0.44 eAED:0.44 QI:0/0/0/1/0/0/2/0/175
MCLTLINPASGWFEIVELPVITEVIIPLDTKGRKGKQTHAEPKSAYFDKSSAMISNLVNKTWFTNSNFTSKPFVTHTGSHKPTSVKNPQANAILEQVHQVISSMLRTAKIDMAPSVEPSDIDKFMTNVAWAICSTYHTVLKASPGAAPFVWDMLFNISFLADWNKIGEYRQHQTD